MDVFEAFALRHSYRGPFTGAAVPRGDLRCIVEAGLQAPSGRNCQTTMFVIVDDPTLLGRIRQLDTRNGAMGQARAFIACIVDRREPAAGEISFRVEDCAAAVMSMLLAVTALGYATVWVDGWLRVGGRVAVIGELLGLPEDKVVRVILPLGVPAEAQSQPEKKPFPERAWFNRYGLDA